VQNTIRFIHGKTNGSTRFHRGERRSQKGDIERMSEEEYNLKASIDKLGVLVPIIKDKLGNIIDGNHRLQITKDAPVFVVDIKNPQDRAIARLAINLHRRMLGSEEKTALLTEIAKLTMWNSKQIADAIGMSQSWVLKYLPGQFKDKEKSVAGEKGAEAVAIQRVAEIQNLAQLPKCERCGVGSSSVKPEQINGEQHNLCERCSQYAKLHHEEIVSHFRFEEKVKRGEVPPKLTTPSKPTETWEYRKAQMTPQHSKMEEQVINLLSEKGVRGIVQDRNFCLLSTTPDIFFASENKAVYLDGQVHANQTDRDEKLRETLQKRGVKVLSIAYDCTSQKETERVTDQILEWLGKKET